MGLAGEELHRFGNCRGEEKGILQIPSVLRFGISAVAAMGNATLFLVAQN